MIYGQQVGESSANLFSEYDQQYRENIRKEPREYLTQFNDPVMMRKIKDTYSLDMLLEKNNP